MSDLQNWLKKLGDKIPGYGGYATRERRRDADKAHREYLADRLRATKQPLTDAVRELTSASGRLSEVGALDRISKKIDMAEQRLRFATYGYTGFFDAVKIDVPQLDAIYQFDLALVEKIEQIEKSARDLNTQSATAEQLKPAATGLEQLVDELNRTFDERTRVLDNFRQSEGGDDAAPGQPMFGA